MSTTVMQADVIPVSSPISGCDIMTSMHVVNIENKALDNVAIVTPIPQISQLVPIQQNVAAAGAALAFPNLTAPVPAPMEVNLLNQTMVTGVPCAKKSKKSKSKSNQDKSSQGSQGENTGRWTAEEHRLFLQGLEEHGKGWKKIASLIKSRTVVQIRTHAQKYFQKLAKARHNGEEGDVAMEGRGVSVNIPPAPPILSNPTQVVKRRRQVSGTKRKALTDVVTSVHRDAKKDSRLPVVSPILAPFVAIGDGEQLTDVSPSALEDSLYRFLTPSATNFLPSVSPSPELSTNAISLPQQNTDYTKTGFSITLPSKDILSGESSPTSVFDVNFSKMKETEMFQQEPPHWFSRGCDVDELLNEAEALDWLSDPGDLVDSYNVITLQPSVTQEVPTLLQAVAFATQATANIAPTVQVDDTMLMSTETSTEVADPIPNISVTRSESLPPVVSYSSMSMNELPALFDATDEFPNKRLKLSSTNLFAAVNTSRNEASAAVNAEVTAAAEDEGFSVFDTAFDEQAFVSALLDSNDNTSLSVLN